MAEHFFYYYYCYYWGGICFIEIAEVKHDWGFISLKRPKEGTVGNSFY